MWSIEFMAEHECSHGCKCIRKGFSSYRMAVIFAYRHVMCTLCKASMREHNAVPDTPEGMEMAWDGSACSAEWIITKT